MRKYKSGFTMIEVMIASIITFIMLSGVLTSLIASMKTSRLQSLQVKAENIANEIIRNEVRNRPFKATTGLSLCGNDSISGTVAYKLKHQTEQEINPNENWDKNLTTNYPEIKKLSKDAKATLEIKPINPIETVSGKKIYSDSRVKVKAIIEWKNNESDTNFSKLEISTIATEYGIFDPVLGLTEKK